MQLKKQQLLEANRELASALKEAECKKKQSDNGLLRCRTRLHSHLILYYLVQGTCVVLVSTWQPCSVSWGKFCN